MIIYIIFFVCNILFGLSLCFVGRKFYSNELNRNKIKRRIYLIVTTLQYGLLCGLRAISMGYDTFSYQIIFDMTPGSWSTLFVRTSYVEMGFSLLCSFVKILGGNYRTLLIICSLFSMGACCVFLNRYSNNVILSVFIIISFPFFYSQFDVIRHFLAVGCFLLAYKYIEEKKFIKYLVLILIGATFHKIVLLFIPLYFVRKIKFDATFVIIMFTITLLLYLFMTDIAFFIAEIMGKGGNQLIETGFLGADAGGFKTMLMYVAILVLSFLAYLLIDEKKDTDRVYLFYIALVVVSSIVSMNARIAIRFIMSFVPLMSIAIPHLFSFKRTSSKKVMIALTICFMLIGLIYHGFMLISNWSNVVPYIPYTQ